MALKLVVVGNGVAGITCALHVRARDPAADITVVSGESPYFFSRTALMYAFMDRQTRRQLEPHERGFWDTHRITRVQDWVTDVEAGAHRVVLKGGRQLEYDRLVLAVGAQARMPDWPGLSAVTDGVCRLVSLQDLDGAERVAATAKRAVVVGGGLIGVELVECLRHLRIPVTFLVREPWYWPMALGAEEAALVEERLRAHGVDVRTGDEVASVQRSPSGRVSGITTAKGESLPCDTLGICIGVVPSVERLRAFQTPPALSRGVVVDGAFRTSLPDVFSAGDCAEIIRPGAPPLLETIWYSAKRQGELCARSLLGEPVDYVPPTFFNSSKFMDVEFTTVGDVMGAPAGTPTMFMRLPGKPVCIRVVHDGNAVRGFNLLGSRWDHTVLCRWVEESRSPAFVREHLHQAQFDAEFSRVPLSRMTVQDLPLRHPARTP